MQFMITLDRRDSNPLTVSCSGATIRRDKPNSPLPTWMNMNTAWLQCVHIISGLKNRNQRIAILSCNALCSMHTWWHPNDSGEFLSRDDADRTRYLLYPKQADYQFSLIPLYFSYHITIMYACQHLHTLTRDMSRWLVTLQRLCFTRTLFCFWTTPALMPIPSNSTGHQLWYHVRTCSFIPLTGKQRISMHPCRDDIVPWMEFESMTFWFGIKCSIPLSYQDDKSGEQDWTLPAMNEEMETLSASYWFIPRVRLSTGWLSPRVRFTSHFRMLVPPSP